MKHLLTNFVAANPRTYLVAKRVLRAWRWMVNLLLRCLDIVLIPVTLVSAVWLRTVRSHGVSRMRVSKSILQGVGVFPIIDHYYEPLFSTQRLAKPLDADRSLPGIDMNIDEQLKMIAAFDYAGELLKLPRVKSRIDEYAYSEGAFLSGDADFYYSLIRYLKPRRIVEIGSGDSTLLALAAIQKNMAEDAAKGCQLTCIEPFGSPWLEKTPATVVRARVEIVDLSLFMPLAEGDILFIDSSHIVRPQGDVLREYLEILPQLKSGVYVHIHDVFTPRDYLTEWIRDDVRLWNEQYLVEAFLTCNDDFKIVGAVNYLKHHHEGIMRQKFPLLALEYSEREPGSLWLRKR